MSVAAWDGFLNDQSNWPAASRIGNATGATTARDTLGDKTFVKRKRMSQEERHLQILQAAVKIIATKGFWGMSLQNISDELGITEAALYHYISSKDDLLNMVLSECYDTIDADEYNAVTAAISSSLSVKPNTSMFCSIRSRCVDLGNATMFRCTSQRRIT